MKTVTSSRRLEVSQENPFWPGDCHSHGLIGPSRNVALPGTPGATGQFGKLQEGEPRGEAVCRAPR